jgi:hypothetical protein
LSDVHELPAPEMIGEVEVDLGWRGRPIALAALGAAVLARSVFDPSRTGMLAPIEMQLLAHLALGAREIPMAEPGEEIESLAGALACDPGDLAGAVMSLIGQGLLVGPSGAEEDRVVITPAGVTHVDAWLHRTVSLFRGCPPTVPGVDDV